MKLSEEAKKYADALISKDTYEIATWAEEDQRRIRASRTQYDPKFSQMTDHHVERIRRGIKSLINAYVEAYKMDGLTIDEEDKDEIIEEIRHMINIRLHHITNSVTDRDFLHPHTGEKIQNMDSYLAGQFEKLIGEGAMELNLARNRMAMEQKKKMVTPTEQHNSTHYTTTIHGPNYGGIQQGGQNNTQNVTINTEFNTKIQELLNLIDVSQDLSPVQKLKASTDIKYVQELNKLKPCPEVQEEAKSRFDGITSVISLSADLVSLGMPIITVLRGFFGL